MGVIGNLPRAQGKSVRKFSVTQAGVTGTGGVATGLTTIDTGGNYGAGVAGAGAVACVANSPTAVPTKVGSITSISGGTVNVVVIIQNASTNVVDAAGANVNVMAVGT